MLATIDELERALETLKDPASVTVLELWVSEAKADGSVLYVSRWSTAGSCTASSGSSSPTACSRASARRTPREANGQVYGLQDASGKGVQGL